MPYWDSNIKFSETSIKNFNDSMVRYAASLNKSLDETLLQFAGRAAEEFMRETPPFVDKSASNTVEAKRRGERAAKKSLMDSVTPASEIFKNKFNNKTLEKVIKKRQYSKWKDVTKNMPKLKNWDAVPFSEDLHLRNRPKGRFDYMKAKKIMTFDEQKWKRYARELQSRVGWMKAGWAVAAEMLGRKVPGWIKRHIGYAKGSCKIDLKSPHKNVVMTNFTPTISRFSGRYNYALDWISKRMIKQMEFILRSEAKKVK